jgi:2-desacetyl-2-hydroxyethyl bacteriochlorophyllide A dehydrogenase
LTTHPEQAHRIVFPSPGQVSLEPFELPAMAPGSLRIRTLYSLMSIGTETTILHGRYAPDSHFARMFGFPQLQTGVQAVGVVEQSAGGAEFAPGDLVYMRMAHGSHQVLPASECSPVPPEIDLKQACWCGLAKTAYRAAWAGRFALDGKVLIIGAGPVGQMAVRWATALGCTEIAAADVSERRLEYAGAGGATHLLCGDIADLAQQVRSLNRGEGPGLIIDSTGNPAVFSAALAAAARFATIILLGDTGYPGQQCLSSDLMTKGLTVQAVHDSHNRDGWTQRRVDALFFEKLGEGRFSLDGMVSHEFEPRQCAQAYALADRERGQTMGILFDWTKMEESHVPAA